MADSAENEENWIKYYTLFNTANDGILLMNREEFIDCNPKALELYGITRSDFCGANPVMFSPERQPDGQLSSAKALYYIEKALQGESQFFEWVHIRHNGQEFYAEVSLNRFLLKGQYLLQAIVRDISERKKMESLLRESEEKYRQIVEHATDFILIHANGKIKFANPASIRILEAESMEELAETPVLSILHPDFRDRAIERIHKILHFNEPSGYLEEVIVTLTGKTIEAEINGVPVMFNGEQAVQVFARDITARKKFEKELIEAKLRAEESDRLKSAFLANMSHEIRTPMSGIMGFADLLKNLHLSDNQRLQFISIIEKSGTRMLNLINDLIDISKIEAGQIHLNNTTFSINEKLNYLLIFFSTEAQKKGICLSITTLPEAPDLLINSDKDKIYAILSNLLKNAIKYTDSGAIDFGCTRIGDSLEFFVRDTGIGIDPENLEAVFDRFVQAENPVSGKNEGAGLGLAISKAYVELLGGQIHVESCLGKGSTFWFSIPFHPVSKNFSS